MTARTVTAVLAAPRDEVFSYLSEIANLPEWATEFAPSGPAHMSTTPVLASASIAKWNSPSPFTTLASPSSNLSSLGPSELFESQHQSVRRELENARAVFRDAT